MTKIEKMARVEFRKLPKKQQKIINASNRITTAPAGYMIENRKRKEKVRRWTWDGSIS